jgi:DNA-binding LytR/AlgR family response regulator
VTTNGGGLIVLVVDDEQPALEDLAYLLRQHPRIESVVTASDATEALRQLRDGSFAAVFLDIRMPGLDGLELARVLSRFAHPQEILFVTAFEQHAVEAFELQAVDYLLKPVRPERLSDAIRRLGAPPRFNGILEFLVYVEPFSLNFYIWTIAFALRHG